jgi:glyoxylase-like metal-dependent hydrolase (beta-lactamase superfamily II)
MGGKGGTNMRKLGLAFAVTALFAVPATAQEDAAAFLSAADRAMGASQLNSIQISGSGWNAFVGQSYAADDDWPRVELQSYELTIDYPSRSAREDYVLVQGDYEVEGGGQQPVVGERRSLNLVSGNYAWTENAQGEAVPQPQAAEERQFFIWTSPHGFIKAAQAADDTRVTHRHMAAEGRTLNIVGFTTMDKYYITGEFNDDYILERVITAIPNPVMGDMQVEIRYTDYRDIGGGIMFPFRYHAHQGDHPLLPVSTGRNWRDYRVLEVVANPGGAALQVPANVMNAQPAPVNVASDEVADGVWRIAGGSHHSIAVEFNDFIAIVEAPQNEARSEAVIAEAKRLIPGKPIRYLVNTHHHFDHLGGVRTYAAEGATIVTHDRNRYLYETVILAPQPRTLSPDRLSRRPFATTGPGPRMIETFTERHAISDGERSLLTFLVQEQDHNENMAMVYLPESRILINADLFGGPADPENVDPDSIPLYRNIERLGLDVDMHVPLHGQPESHAEFERVVGPHAVQQTAAAGGG